MKPSSSYEEVFSSFKSQIPSMKAELSEYLNRSVGGSYVERTPKVSNNASNGLLGLTKAKVLENRAKLQTQDLARRSQAYKIAAHEGQGNRVMNIVNAFQPVEMHAGSNGPIRSTS